MFSAHPTRRSPLITPTSWKDYVIPVQTLEDNLEADEGESGLVYDFLSNVPDDIEEDIEDRSISAILQWINDNDRTSSLLAENEVNSLSSSSIDSTAGHNGFVEDDIFTFVSPQPFSTSQVGIAEIGIVETSFLENSVSKDGSTEIDFVEENLTESSTREIGFFHKTILETTFVHPNSTEISETQVNFNEMTPIEVSPAEISFPVNSASNSFISQSSTSPSSEILFTPSVESEQFFSVHNSTPKITNVLNNTATKIWSNLLLTETQLDIDFQITDLPSGQLAEATNTSFDVFEEEKTGRQRDKEQLEASLTSDPLLAIANGDFSISDTTTDSFGWDIRGASSVENGQAVLTEDSPLLSNFTQTFTVPESAKTVQFKLIDAELCTSELSPLDAFEVALLDTNTNESLVTDNDLTQTDSLLNIQNDGTAYFSDKVRIGDAASGEIIELDRSHTITVDISHLAAGTEATLYFDLLGFGDIDSRVVIDDVLLSDQNLIPPVAVGDTATTIQGQPVMIDILNNDRDDDGIVATNSVQIQTEPDNGFVIPREDGTVSYIPDTSFAGEDSFTYMVQDNDGQQII